MTPSRRFHRHAPAATLGALAGLVLAGACTTLGAQPVPISAGVTAASFEWHDGRREHAVATILQAAPRPWLMLGAVPTLLRAEGPGGTDVRGGFADLPVFAGATRGVPLPGRPMLAIAGVATLPTGDAERGLGRGVALVGAEGTVAVSPLRWVTVRAGGARLLRDGGLVPQGAPRSTVFGDLVATLGGRTNVGAGYAAELGDASSAPWEPSRAVNAALVHAVAGRTALLVGAGHSLRGPGPRWSLSVGLGTAFGGVSPLGATSVRGRAPLGPTPTLGAMGPLAPAARRPVCGLLSSC